MLGIRTVDRPVRAQMEDLAHLNAGAGERPTRGLEVGDDHAAGSFVTGLAGEGGVPGRRPGVGQGWSTGASALPPVGELLGQRSRGE
jgi:hypothetical protein